MGNLIKFNIKQDIVAITPQPPKSNEVGFVRRGAFCDVTISGDGEGSGSGGNLSLPTDPGTDSPSFKTCNGYYNGINFERDFGVPVGVKLICEDVNYDLTLFSEGYHEQKYTISLSLNESTASDISFGNGRSVWSSNYESERNAKNFSDHFITSDKEMFFTVTRNANLLVVNAGGGDIRERNGYSGEHITVKFKRADNNQIIEVKLIQTPER